MNRDERGCNFAIVGPTCVGKTAYVSALLERFPFEVINLDSFQIFDHFLVGTGRADSTFGDKGHLYGVVAPDRGLTSEEYVGRARAIAAEIVGRGNIPIYEGGSISYLRALTAHAALKVVVLTPPDDAWLRLAIERRLDAADRKRLFAEIKNAQKGNRNVKQVLDDDVVYRPVVDLLSGSIDLETARSRVVMNLLRRAHEQLTSYLEFDVTRVTAGKPDSLSQLVQIIETEFRLQARKIKGQP